MEWPGVAVPSRNVARTGETTAGTTEIRHNFAMLYACDIREHLYLGLIDNDWMGNLGSLVDHPL